MLEQYCFWDKPNLNEIGLFYNHLLSNFKFFTVHVFNSNHVPQVWMNLHFSVTSGWFVFLLEPSACLAGELKKEIIYF